MVSISGDLPILKFLENSTLFQEMVSISGDRPILKFLENSTLFQEMVSTSSNRPLLKFFRKLHAFLRNGLNIGWPAHLKLQKKTSYLREIKQCWFTIPILFCSSVDLRFLTSAVFQKLGTILAFITPSSARLVLWQYSMHVFCYLFWKHRSPFLL